MKKRFQNFFVCESFTRLLATAAKWLLIKMIPIHKLFLGLSSVFVLVSLCCSFYLIARHQEHMTQLSIQPKIVGIIWMVPIYSVNSFLSLWMPSIALYLNMLRDCYEAYVLYLFLALMLSYLDADEDDYKVARYLETRGPVHLPWPLTYCFPAALPTGRAFLRYCKFGTLQYCIFRPLATFLALILSWAGVYHESDFSPKYGYLYVVIIVNLSVAYAFVVLATFYTCLKELLEPFHPVGKFLCIKFVIFFAFWQV